MKWFDKIKVINVDAMYYCANETNVDDKYKDSDRI